jgi:hypothetical protein
MYLSSPYMPSWSEVGKLYLYLFFRLDQEPRQTRLCWVVWGLNSGKVKTFSVLQSVWSGWNVCGALSAFSLDAGVIFPE